MYDEIYVRWELHTDRLYALLSHDVYWLLVRRRRWNGARWRQHVTEQAVR